MLHSVKFLRKFYGRKSEEVPITEEALVTEKHRNPPDVRNRLFNENQGLAIHFLRRRSRLRPGTTDWEDALQEVYMGLLRAAETYDPSFDATFATYAEWKMRDGLGRWRSKTRLIRLPTEATIAPHHQEYADRAKDVIGMGEARGRGGAPLAEGLVAKAEDSPYEYEELLAAIQRLPVAQRKIINQYYYDHMTLEEIATEQGLTKSRIGQLIVEARARIEKDLRARGMGHKGFTGTGHGVLHSALCLLGKNYRKGKKASH